MPDVTQLLNAMEWGVSDAAARLLPLVYEELRKLAAAKMAQEKPGQTLQATALVHEAWLRLAGPDQRQDWNSRGHFFGQPASRKGARRHGTTLRPLVAPTASLLFRRLPVGGAL